MAAVWLTLVPVGWVAAAGTAGAIHELGHLIFLRAAGAQVWCIRIDAFGAKIETGPMEPQEELMCALAGPAAGLLLALSRNIIPKIALCAVIQSVFNLLPVWPMDGARVLRSLRAMAQNRLCKEKSVAKAHVSGYNDSD